MVLGSCAKPASPPRASFGPDNPFYATSTLPFHAPPFDKMYAAWLGAPPNIKPMLEISRS